MGQLTLPDAGLIYLDANCLIYSVEHIEPYDLLLIKTPDAIHAASRAR